jgi:hypothetical protein
MRALKGERAKDAKGRERIIRKPGNQEKIESDLLVSWLPYYPFLPFHASRVFRP